MHGEITLDLLTFLMVLRRETRQRPHLVLAGGDRYIPLARRAEAREALDAELYQLGLVEDGQIHPDFQHTLNLLGNPRLEYFGWIQREHSNYTLLAVAARRDALLLSRTDDVVWLCPTVIEDAGELAARFVERLPDLGGANMRPFSVAETELQSIGRDPGGNRTAESAQLEELFTLRRSGGGQLHAAVRDHTGERYQMPDKLDYIDTSAGRVLTYFTGNEPGARTLSIVPGSPQWLGDKLAELSETAATRLPRQPA
ncbi:MAG: hypothetical protein GEU98_08220 [Pseudonocardiaceae bacterium]|nr:hypothetical protein [Pseudonocardiaceae bacterium]